MKCICHRAALHEALAAISSVVLTRTPKPILQCVRLSAEESHLTLTAYDQEVGLRYRLEQVEIKKPGETLVPCDRLVAIVRESQDETLAFETSDDLLHIRGADSHFQIVGQNVREFPPVPDMEGDCDFKIQIGNLRDASEKTLFAAARENTRYAINGVLWQRKGKKLQFVATDGRRLALSEATLEDAAGEESQAIVPIKALSLLGRLHFDADEIMEVRLSANQVVMRGGPATISSVLVEGHFPKWQDVLPREHNKELTIPTAQLLSGVRRAALLANIESKGIKMSLEASKMVLTSRSAEQGEATVELPIEYKDEPMTIGFNPEFLVDALKVCDDTVTLKLSDAARPGMLTSGTNFTYVVMPVNLS